MPTAAVKTISLSIEPSLQDMYEFAARLASFARGARNQIVRSDLMKGTV
jgi:hypothetical protein